MRKNQGKAFFGQFSKNSTGVVNNSQRVDPRVSCFIDNIMILNWGRSLLNSASSQYMLHASCKLTALPPLLPPMLSLSQNPAPKILPAKIPVLQKFSFHLHALKATLCSPLQFSQRWGQYGQGHHNTIILLKRRSCTKPYQSIKWNAIFSVLHLDMELIMKDARHWV